MDIFSVLTMIGGLALFLYGMETMGDGLAKASGGKLETVLEKLTSNKIKAVLLGAGVTAVIQSSSATTVMVVGFVNSGIMKLSQAVGIIMGANVGTTVTSWILSLSGIESSSFFIQFLKPTSFSPIFALIGIILLIFTKDDKKKNIGTILVGFAILMFGMDTMSSAVKPLANVPEFTNILTMFSNPFLGMIAGAVLTAVIQSSSASVGILQALCVTGSLSYGTALPIIMGQNIGTCITAIISAIGAGKNAKRAALIHLYFNLIGTVIFMLVFYGVNTIVNFAFLQDAASAAGIAIIHSVFNVSATIVLLPFANVLEKLAYITIAGNDKEAEKIVLLDERFLEQPSFAVTQCKNVAINMAKISRDALINSISLLDHYDKDMAIKVSQMEDMVDHYEDELGTYMVKLSSHQLTQSDSRTLSILLHCIGDFERISDHAVNIMESAKQMYKEDRKFSDKAAVELTTFGNAVIDIVNMAEEVFEREDMKLAETIEPLEEVIDYLNAEIKERHINRLRNGKCTIGLGFILSDITTNYERVADHCSNIAVCLIQVKANGFETHEYLENLKHGENKTFETKYREFKDKYSLS